MVIPANKEIQKIKNYDDFVHRISNTIKNKVSEHKSLEKQAWQAR